MNLSSKINSSQFDVMDSEMDIDSSSNSQIKSFTTNDFMDKIKETVGLAREIIQCQSVKKNDKIQNLLKIQCYNTLKILTKLNQNDLNPNSKDCDFARLKFGDEQKISRLIEIDDALIDKTIHYFECAKNVPEKKSDSQLLQVRMNVDTFKNNPTLSINDYRRKILPVGSKRKSPEDITNDSPSKLIKHQNITFIAASNVKRPQIAYKIKVDNAYSTPFIPKLTRKPNALVPLEESLKPTGHETASPRSDKIEMTYPNHYYPHPYQHEIKNFVVEPGFFQMKEAQIQKPLPLEQTEFKLINKRNELSDLVKILSNYKEIAVDLEHHSFRSYQGLTCLLQISTEDCDYIIDVFPLWNDMEMLNEIFTSPSILKVFHSSQFDIIWLQRDLGIYVVNMFDTWIAATILGYPHVSLSYLVNRFCDFQMDKRLQLADWRIRPIPYEMLQYARGDTHFLLYIYRKLKQELLKNDPTANLLRVVMERSQETCLKRYEKKLLENKDHVHLLWKNNLRFNAKQMAALKSLYQWRDVIGRQEDESTGYILPNNLLLKICEILPREQQGILACCNPIPPLVRQYINEIHKIILDARSKVVVDHQTDQKVSYQEKRRITIDLTKDSMIDHYHHPNKSLTKIIEEHNHQDQHYEHGKDQDDDSNQPLLCWSTQLSKFIPNQNLSVDESSRISVSNLDGDRCSKQSLIDLFDAKQKQSCKPSNGKKLFDGYVTFYQRYLNQIKKNETGNI